MNYNLKTFDTIKWLRNRYKSRVKDKYVLYDGELKEQIMMKAVFNSIDRDKSKFLDRSELYDMFVKYGINISKQKLKEFFQSIDEDEDDKLNWSDFKQALQNQEALGSMQFFHIFQVFVELMKKLRDEYEISKSDENITFIPLSFPQMIQYMNYCVLREELIGKIHSDTISNYQKHKQCVNLLTLEDSCYRNIKLEGKDADEEISIQKIDQSQIVQLKRYQERELKFKRLEKVHEISAKKFYTSPTQDLSQSESVRLNSDLEQMKVNLSIEITRARNNVDNFLDILNNNNQKSRIYSRQQSKVSSRSKSRQKYLEMRKNTVLLEAEQEVKTKFKVKLEKPKFKLLNKASNQQNQEQIVNIRILEYQIVQLKRKKIPPLSRQQKS